MKKFICIAAAFALVLLYAFTHRPVSWVAIGDSITYLNEHPEAAGFRMKKGYMSRVTEKLPYIQYQNQGYSGWTARRIADSIEKLGITKADVYSIFLGTNDWWQGHRTGQWKDYAGATGDTTIYGAFRIIVNKLRSLNPEAAIILITPMQRGDFVYFANMNNNAYGSYKPKAGQTLEQVVNVVRDIAAHEHFKLINLYHNKKLDVSQAVHFKRLHDPATGDYKNYTYPDYTTIPFNPAKDEYPYPVDAINMTYDGLHPSDKGFEYIAEKLVKVMKKL